MPWLCTVSGNEHALPAGNVNVRSTTVSVTLGVVAPAVPAAAAARTSAPARTASFAIMLLLLSGRVARQLRRARAARVGAGSDSRDAISLSGGQALRRRLRRRPSGCRGFPGIRLKWPVDPIEL